jgi:uncharacterized protein
MSGFTARIADRLRRLMPSREELEGIRLVRPFARRQELWRFTRRSVPRGVAIGVFIGILAMIPGVQIVCAALLCVPFRGNIPLAAGMTFLSNPGTTPFFLAAAILAGNQLGFHADVTTFHALYARGAGWDEWQDWLLSDAAPAMLAGLLMISLASAGLSYLVSVFVWRWRVGRKVRMRRQRPMGPI